MDLTDRPLMKADIETITKRDSASPAWQRQADGLVARVATVSRNQEVPVRI